MRVRLALALFLTLFAILTLLDRVALLELLARRTGGPLLFALAEGLAIVGIGGLLRRGKHVDISVDFLIGYPLFGTLLFLIASMKIAAATLVPLLVIGIAIGIWLLLRRYGDDAYVAPEMPPLRWPVFAVAAVLGCAFAIAQQPPSIATEVVHHLAIPQTWVLERAAVELPLLARSSFPLGIESADVLPLLLLGPIRGGVASHFLHLFAAIAATLLIARRTSSWLATAAIVTTPALAIAAGSSLPDWPLLGAFVVLFFALQDDDRNAASAATAAGLLTSYAFLPFAIAAWALRRRIPSWTALLGIVFFVRNAILTGNPFAGITLDLQTRAVALADFVYETSFLDEALGASLFALPLFATGAIAIAAAVLAAALFLLGASARLLVPYLAVAAISGASALKRPIIAVLAAIAVVVQTLMAVWMTTRPEEKRPSRESVAWLNESLPRRSRTLLVGHDETYWFARRVRGGDGDRISRYLDLPTPEALRERLREDGITHVAVIATNEELTPAAQRMLARTLDRYASNVAARENATLFTLK